MKSVTIILFALLLHRTQLGFALKEMNLIPDLDKVSHLGFLLSEILLTVRLHRCLAIITDDNYHTTYNQDFFRASSLYWPYFYIKVAESEDLMSPNYQMLQVVKLMRLYYCDIYLVTLLNGHQAKRFFQFIYKHKFFTAQQSFIVLHDDRLFVPDMYHIWSSAISTVFIKTNKSDCCSFLISTISPPTYLQGLTVTTDFITWNRKTRLKNHQLFWDKCTNLNGKLVPIIVSKHLPMTMANADNSNYIGLEVEIIKTLAEGLNFTPLFYANEDNGSNRWGRKLINGSYNGLLGEMMKNKAQFAIGDLHMYTFYNDILDFSWPYNHECLTFLTPESSQDNSWKTLIQPFSAEMWTGVLLSLLLVGSIFYAISYIHSHMVLMLTSTQVLEVRKKRKNSLKALMNSHGLHDVNFRKYINHMPLIQPQQKDIFDNIADCILFTSSMLMYVALPRMPRNWPLRVLTGWYWLYCILITATYRASFTAILANPPPRITIDTLQQLVQSRITVAVGEKENERFFNEAFDEEAQKIATKMDVIDNIDGLTQRIAMGDYAYYDNEYFLRHIRLMGGDRQNQVLHIMGDCIVHLPVAIGMTKNSPFKPNVDKYLKRFIESGLTNKWLKDITKNLPSEEETPQEAFMDMTKFISSFGALGIGYLFSFCAIGGEKLYFKYIVERHPAYDVYNPSLYYKFTRRYH
ncbi:glutamate receptor ionotropic, delta-2 [Teleopsis dalmanni]|uniref:glutamate receptor ionotropic, delta-2 n=1 Tax=Teleopsis dalmanni TaxID=139649 RepID=UPI0018CE6374|nr:glutamate receptor ionotropic, delta-2 [Teleopsis dalmanni]